MQSRILWGQMQRSLLALICCSVSAVVMAADDEATTNAFVGLRTAPSLEAQIIDVLRPGIPLKVLGSVGDFYKVERASDGVQAYVLARLLDGAPSDVGVVSVSDVIATSQVNLNMRSGPSMDAAVIGVLKKGTVAQVLSQDGEFAHLKRLSDGQQGYSVVRLLSIEATPVVLEPHVIHPPAEDAVAAAQPDAPVVIEDVSVELEQASDERLEEPAPPVVQDPWSRWSVAGVAGFGMVGIDAAELQQKLQPHATVAQVNALDEDNPYGGLSVTWHFHPAWGIQLGLSDLGEYDSVINLQQANVAAVQRVLEDEHPIGGVAAQLALHAQRANNAWVLQARLGGQFNFRSDLDVIINGQSRTINGDEVSLLGGLGLSYRFSRHWSLGLDASFIDRNQPLMLGALQLRYAL